MSEDEAIKFSTSNPSKLDLILLTLQRIQEDLEMAKCQIKTSMSELANQQNYMNEPMLKLERRYRDINERLHGIELRLDRQNSST
jgi:hypothetical protein